MTPGACFRISFSIEFQYFPLLVNSPRKIENSIENEIRKQTLGVKSKVGGERFMLKEGVLGKSAFSNHAQM